MAKSFGYKYGKLTVAQAKELNEAARWYCEHEIISESEEYEN